MGIKSRVIECVAVTDDGEEIANEASTMQLGEQPRWFGLCGGDLGFVPSTSAHTLTVIEPVHEAVDAFLDMEGTDPELAAAFAVELGELSSHEETERRQNIDLTEVFHRWCRAETPFPVERAPQLSLFTALVWRLHEGRMPGGGSDTLQQKIHIPLSIARL
jgi:hypothetical protein